MEYELMIRELKKKLKKKSRYFSYKFEKSNLGADYAYDYCEELFDDILKEFTQQQLEKYDLIHKLKVGFVPLGKEEIIVVSY